MIKKTKLIYFAVTDTLVLTWPSNEKASARDISMESAAACQSVWVIGSKNETLIPNPFLYEMHITIEVVKIHLKDKAGTKANKSITNFIT